MAMDERQKVAHLLRRAGFGASPDELASYIELGFEATLAQLLDPQSIDESSLELPGFDPEAPLSMQLIQARWIYRMIHSSRPLVEKMAFFWHGHFATSIEKVKSVTLMWDQVETFRQLGLGSFEQLLLAVSQDPAMLVWLDNSKSKKESPNENYGRELLELFSLGVGNYTEDDVKAAARAFTGWSIQLEENTYVGDEDVADEELMSEAEIKAKKKAVKDFRKQRDATFAFRAKWHDSDEKTFLGQTGNWDGEDIVRIIVSDPACASFIARKLFSFFVWDNPAESTIAPFAEIFSATNGDIRQLMEAIFRSGEFLSDEAMLVKVKSPVELVAGTMRVFGGGTASNDLFRSTGRMGQTLFAPPNVGGWPSGLGWIGPSSLLERYNLMIELMGARKGTELSAETTKMDVATALLQGNPSTPEELVDTAVNWLLAREIQAEQHAVLVAFLGDSLSFDPADEHFIGKVRGLLRLVTTIPSYQLN